MGRLLCCAKRQVRLFVQRQKFPRVDRKLRYKQRWRTWIGRANSGKLTARSEHQSCVPLSRWLVKDLGFSDWETLIWLADWRILVDWGSIDHDLEEKNYHKEESSNLIGSTRLRSNSAKVHVQGTSAESSNFKTYSYAGDQSVCEATSLLGVGNFRFDRYGYVQG